MKLHNTCQPHIYYTAFENLPELIKDFIEKYAHDLVEVECSFYTVYKPTAFIRHEATIDGQSYWLEITLGDINDDEFLDDESRLDVAHDMIECFDWQQYNVYLTER